MTYYPSSNTYFYDAPYMDWTYIVRNSYMNVGSISFATLKRGTSSWKLTLTNIIRPVFRCGPKEAVLSVDFWPI